MNQNVTMSPCKNFHWVFWPTKVSTGRKCCVLHHVENVENLLLATGRRLAQIFTVHLVVGLKLNPNLNIKELWSSFGTGPPQKGVGEVALLLTQVLLPFLYLHKQTTSWLENEVPSNELNTSDVKML